QDGGQRVGDAFAGNIGRGAVHRLEHAWVGSLGIDVAAGGQADAAGNDGAQVGKNVAEEIAGHNHIKGFRLADQIHHGCVNQERLGLDIGKIAGNTFEDIVPQDHAPDEGVGLGDGGDLFTAFAGSEEGGTHDPFAAAASVDRRLHGNVLAGAFVQ